MLFQPLFLGMSAGGRLKAMINGMLFGYMIATTDGSDDAGRYRVYILDVSSKSQTNDVELFFEKK